MTLKGRNAVVTGGSRGIGRAIALAFAKAGANVAVVYAGNEAAAKETCALLAPFGGTVRTYVADVADETAAKTVSVSIAGDFGGVDILVNNAGITRDNLLLRMSEADFDEVIGVSLKGAFHFIKYLARPLIKSPAGRIINIASVSGLMGNAGQANYSAAKAALIGLTKTVAREFSSRTITCNAIAPGFIETDMTAALPAAVYENIKTAVPLKRMGNAEEVAALALFLAGDSAAYITGEVIRVDGGMGM